MNVTASVSFTGAGRRSSPETAAACAGAHRPRSRRDRAARRSRQISGSSTMSPDPQREQRRQNADEEHRAPAPPRQHDQPVTSGGAVPDRPRALHEAQRLAAMLGRPRFGRRARRRSPIRRRTRGREHSEERELDDVLREAAGRGEHRVDQHARHQRAGPADSDPRRRRKSYRRRRTRASVSANREGRAVSLVRPNSRHDRREDERVEHHVERVEHPPERGGDERASRRRRAVRHQPNIIGSPEGCAGSAIGCTVTPAASRPARSRRSSSWEPGVSPCVQIV